MPQILIPGVKLLPGEEGGVAFLPEDGSVHLVFRDGEGLLNPGTHLHEPYSLSGAIRADLARTGDSLDAALEGGGRGEGGLRLDVGRDAWGGALATAEGFSLGVPCQNRGGMEVAEGGEREGLGQLFDLPGGGGLTVQETLSQKGGAGVTDDIGQISVGPDKGTKGVEVAREVLFGQRLRVGEGLVHESHTQEDVVLREADDDGAILAGEHLWDTQALLCSAGAGEVEGVGARHGSPQEGEAVVQVVLVEHVIPLGLGVTNLEVEGILGVL
mmetsp:Transcript_62577/g.130025  ORF Transcript_62577/g.130025 Transcript_62577/m.130025 type:complete len:271 (-) Transcript_62577:299-1111(-)